MDLERLPDHPAEYLCRSKEDDPSLGRVAEAFFLSVHKSTEHPEVKDAVEIALYDLQKMMASLFDLLEFLDNDPDIELTAIGSSPLVYHS